MRRYITDGFYCWIKLRLPDELFIGLPQDSPNLLNHLVQELANANLDNCELASRAIVELLNLSGKIKEYTCVWQYIL